MDRLDAFGGLLAGDGDHHIRGGVGIGQGIGGDGNFLIHPFGEDGEFAFLGDRGQRVVIDLVTDALVGTIPGHAGLEGISVSDGQRGRLAGEFDADAGRVFDLEIGLNGLLFVFRRGDGEGEDAATKRGDVPLLVDAADEGVIDCVNE